MDQRDKINHLLRRAAFGPRFSYPDFRDTDEAVAWLFDTSAKPAALSLRNWKQPAPGEMKNASVEERKAYREREKTEKIALQNTLLDRYAKGSSPLREKMTLFWMGHFACRPTNPVFNVNYYNHIHRHALGNFTDLLDAMIRDAAMLLYLNNNQNRKGNPNENFARELLELFTLGRGHYTENDIREGARALTGWGFNREGNFEFREQLHDPSVKHFLGSSGTFNGGDLVAIIVKQPACAEFITTKLVRFLVAEQTDPVIIKELSKTFVQSGFDISGLLKKIFASGWFYDEKYTGNKIKSPLELVAGIAGDFSITFEDPMGRFAIQRILGQNLFDPPNVAGWPRDRAWIDSSALIYRMKLPELLLQEAESVFDDKEQFDAMEVMTGNQGKSGGRKIKTTFTAKHLLEKTSGMTAAESDAFMVRHFLSRPLADGTMELIRKNTGAEQGPARMFRTAIHLMCLPEYQLC